MSFALDVKKELTTIPVTKKCCQLAQIAGFLRFAGSITITDGRMGVRVSTNNPAVARLFITLIKEYFGTKGSLSIDNAEMPLAGGRVYELNITPDMNAEGILREAGLLGVKEGLNYVTDGISAEVIKKRCCKKAFLRGAFLACGTITDPAKTYHLELPCAREYLAGDVRKLVNSFGLKARITQRRGRYIVYLKDAEQISDFLGIIGASAHLLHFEDVRVLLGVLQKLVDKGNTVLVIEHNMDVIKVADHIIDIGPEGGMEGGNIVCTGTPEEVAQCAESYTGQFLKEEL